MTGDAPAPGEILAGKYVVERALGKGGMGVVVAARHRELDARVAVKLLRTDPPPSVDAIERFQREARAAAKLRSDHVARVNDVGVLEGGVPFMVMEHLDGADLAELLRAGPIAPGVAAELIAQACEAVGEAHAGDIVHRDLKPSNLFLTRTVRGHARVKVLDFGISKLRGAGPSDGLAETASGTMLGTPLYMSPEQMRSSRDVDARTDVWSLGLVLFEMLTGGVPWTTASLTALAVDVTSKAAPDVRTIRPEVPAELAAIVARCLEKDASARFADAAALGAALAPLREEATPAITDALLGRDRRARSAIEAAATTPAATPTPARAAATPAVSSPSPVTAPAPSSPAAAGGARVVVGIGIVGMVAIGSMYVGQWFFREPPPPPAVVHARPCAGEPTPPCASDARAWCRPAGVRVACCAPGLVPTDDGFCECPPGGANEPEAIASGCTAATDATTAAASARVRTEIRAHVPAFRRCYEAALDAGASPSGRITLGFTVSPWGEVWDPRIDASSLPSASVQRCVLAELETLRFDPPMPGSRPLEVTYPLDFGRTE